MENNDVNKIIGLTGIVVALVVVVGLGGYWLFNGGDQTSSVGDAIPEEEATPQNELVVASQFPGKIVFVSLVRLQQGGFVVIHKRDAIGNAGTIIGSGYFASGSRTGEVTLSEALVDGMYYIAMLHSDDGDRVFDAVKDLPIIGTDGAPIQVIFEATEDLPEEKG